MEYIIKFRAESEMLVKVEADSVSDAKMFALRKVDNLVSYNHRLKKLPKDVGVEVVFLQPLLYTESINLESGIMTPHNSHSIDLVRKINYAWEANKDGFKYILLALMKRDIVEMVDWNIFGEASEIDDTYEELYKQCEEHWEDFAYDYLMRVADDTDLEIILNMVK